MSIGLTDTVTNTCQDIRAGTLVRLFSTYTSNQLLPLVPSPVNQHPTLNSRKEDYITVEREQRLVVCDQPNFAKKHWLKRMALKLMPKCPWFEHTAAQYRVDVQYTEATTPTNGVTSPIKSTTEDWGTGEASKSGTYTTDPINPPWLATYSSDGRGECTILVEQIDSDPTNPLAPVSIRVTATLVRFGRPHDFLSGTAPVQVHTMTCEAWNAGQQVGGFWTGLAFPVGPLGLVMSLSWNVQGGQGFIG